MAMRVAYEVNVNQPRPYALGGSWRSPASMASSAHSASAGAAVRPTSVDNIDVSIVLTGRNDNYGGDFTVRCERALRFNWDNLSKAHVNAEVVFVEWNPVAHREYLVQELERDLPEIPPVRFRRYV